MYVRLCFSFFFFKQKTAYEMRISDWSSDVCSSDLLSEQPSAWALNILNTGGAVQPAKKKAPGAWGSGRLPDRSLLPALFAIAEQAQQHDEQRSEEHTSELQSLMRISYAVFCLKKKTTRNNV